MQELTLPASVAPSGAVESASRLALERMLDVVDYGLVLVLPSGRVGFANQVARQQLDNHPLLRLQGSALHLPCIGSTTALRDALFSAVHKGCQKLLTLGSEGLPSLSIAVVPLVEPGTARIAGAMLLLGKCRVCDELSIDAFGRLHALTMAEQRVLRIMFGHFGFELGAVGDVRRIADQ